MGQVVVAHVHDDDAGVYRLVVAEETRVPVAVLDEDGDPVFGDDGSQVFDERSEYTAVEDFVFAADDDRWAGKSLEQIAKSQRRTVKRVLAGRTVVEPPQLASMPGEGNRL